MLNLVRAASAITLLATTISHNANTAGAADDATGSSRPNIIVILADDMGYSDIGCYGGEIETPVLDGLASNGLRFTQFYNTARCCPTRASLMSGLYPHQAGIGHMMSDNGHDGYRGDLNRQCMTIAEVLQGAGYGTYMAGKWHVTKSVKPDGPKHNWPLQRGYDRFYGTIHGAGSFFDPNSLTRNNVQISPDADPEYQPRTYYYTDAISHHASRYIREHVEDHSDQPFFVYVAYTAAHWPMHALPEDIEKYKGRYDAGYAAIRNARLKKMVKLGLVPEGIRMSAQAEDWEKVEHVAWELRCMEVYAAMVDRMDQGIGNIVNTLKDTNQLDNTLVLFMQDNGGCAEGLGRRAAKGKEQRPAEPETPMAKNELQFDMIPKKARNGWPVIQGPGVMPGPADTYIAYGRGWANVSNTPFREYKHWVHEGGISTPLIAHWPAGIGRGGQLERQPGHLVDIMATCVDVAGANYPQMYQGESIKPLEGRSLAPTFAGKSIDREALFWEHEGNCAIRVNEWKLVRKENGPWELYNVVTDRSEQTNVAASEPTRVRILSALWEDYAERANVYPLTPWKSKKAKFSKKKRFSFGPEARVAREQSPMIQNKSFRINAVLADPGTSGVIVAQGGTAAGYSIYQADGQLHFAARTQGELFTFSGKAPQKGTIRCDVTKEGNVTIRQNGSVLLEGSVAGGLDSMPIDGLQVGIDTGGLVGEYPEAFGYDGDIQEVRVAIQ